MAEKIRYPCLVSVVVNGSADVFEKVQILSAAHFHAFPISDPDKRNPLHFSKPRWNGLYFPRGHKGEDGRFSMKGRRNLRRSLRDLRKPC